MKERRASADCLARWWLSLSSEAQLFLADHPEEVKKFLAEQATKAAKDVFVAPLSDEEAIAVLSQETRYVGKEMEVRAMVLSWRQYASRMGYTGPAAWLFREGFTLKYHAPKAGPCYKNLEYLQGWELKNDEPTRHRLIFWVPRLAEGSLSKSTNNMKALRAKLCNDNSLPAHHCDRFGSIAELFSLILAHFKRVGERVPLNCNYAASDSFRAGGSRLVAGYFDEVGLYCAYWWDGGCGRGGVSFFLLGVEELGL